MARKDIHKDGEKTQFKKGQSGNPKGRPRKWVSQLADQGYKKSEVVDCITAMLSMNMDELEQAYKDKNSTVLEMTVANAIRTGIKKGNLSSIESLLDRVYGRPKQEIEQTVTKIKPPTIRFTDPTDEQE